ncbi:prevent-host-death family protein [Spirosoma sp. KCTC 42546]|uniref:prevent-host-death family protein n=1 Tax=Spirosoma sp. KCTC 42546 TaxID=2520506 RepID=UPI001157936A|nr:prevent-host-death family protein [Spirosoma sp. KCTC 42546]QDK77263.1 prevent-host-death family protein [Spirosoma sp. KCTC 42546]
MTLNAQIIQSEGKPAFTVIAYEAIQQSLASFDNLEDFADYVHALTVKNATTTWHTLDDVKKELGL